jgi:hypothetical protein
MQMFCFICQLCLITHVSSCSIFKKGHVVYTKRSFSKPRQHVAHVRGAKNTSRMMTNIATMCCKHMCILICGTFIGVAKQKLPKSECAVFYNTKLLCWVGKMVSQNECVFFVGGPGFPKWRPGRTEWRGKHERFRNDGLAAVGSTLDIMLDERVEKHIDRTTMQRTPKSVHLCCRGRGVCI